MTHVSIFLIVTTVFTTFITPGANALDCDQCDQCNGGQVEEELIYKEGDIILAGESEISRKSTLVAIRI